jgi:acyl-CoA synthetase (AMP-forming)/AMP-acid ligase II
MIALDDSTTIGDAFADAARAYATRAFLAVPKGAHRPYHQNGYEITFAEAARAVEALIAHYRKAGYGPGHRVAMLLDNRPEYFLHKLALNTLGVSAVPINPDYRANEIAYLLEHAEVDLALVASERREQLAAGMAISAHQAPVVIFDDLAGFPSPKKAAHNDAITGATEASILYTSGTTGRPKGCILSHGYELASGAWYANAGGLAAFRPEEAVLQAHPAVKQVAVLAVEDEMREEEVLACIVLHDDAARGEAADALFRHCYDQLAYFKAPGWIYFTDALPTTGTQKIQKHQIFPLGSDPRALPGMIDLRERKKREMSRAS